VNRIANRRLLGVLGAVFLTTGSFTAAVAPANAANHAGENGVGSTPSNVRDVCGRAEAGHARCFAKIRTDVHGGLGVRGPAAHTASGAAATVPGGFGPADLHSAYNLPTTGGAGQTIALVDAGDDPAAEADLAVYRATYGLPACTTANGCFHKVNQRGAGTPLPADASWGAEIALDLDMASAACPECKILLVEADDDRTNNLAAAVDTAVASGATEVSNSYGSTESSLTPGDAVHYTHPGTAILASSGDSGYGLPNEPAVYSSVIAVGGTSLKKDSSAARGWSETAWSGAGSGCSSWVDKPAWQTDPNCPGRMVADVSAVADWQTGVAVYDTADGYSGWMVAGGTSASSPFIAGVIALAGNPAEYASASPFYALAAHAGLNDIVSGSNANHMDCGGDYQCNAVPGYDGPTGMGTPNGLSAF